MSATLPPPVDPELETFERAISERGEWSARLARLAQLLPPNEKKFNQTKKSSCPVEASDV